MLLQVSMCCLNYFLFHLFFIIWNTFIINTVELKQNEFSFICGDLTNITNKLQDLNSPLVAGTCIGPKPAKYKLKVDHDTVLYT